MKAPELIAVIPVLPPTSLEENDNSIIFSLKQRIMLHARMSYRVVKSVKVVSADVGTEVAPMELRFLRRFMIRFASKE